MRLANKFMIGADPEFVVIAAKGEKPLALSGSAHGTVGWDHGGLVCELRPNPSQSVRLLVQRMRQALRTSLRLRPHRRAIWRAGAVYEWGQQPSSRRFGETFITLGGHVHFDFMPGKSHLKVTLEALNRATNALETLDILPKSESEMRHRLFGCGDSVYRLNLGERDISHLEYRAPCSWLMHPVSAITSILLLKLAILKIGDMPVIRDWSDFQRLVMGFAPLDADARWLNEQFPRGLAYFQHPPDSDMRETWGVEKT